MSSRTLTNGEDRGILRTGQRHPREGGDGNNEGNGALGGGRGVTFSTTVSTSTFVAASRARDDDKNDQEYDSDDEDAVLASGDALMGSSSSRKRNRNVDDDNDVIKDSAVRTPAEVAEAKRKRGRVRRQEDKFDLDNEANDDDDDDLMRQRRYLDDGGPDDRDAPEYAGGNLSLITDRAANPDAYESNAYGNASCPVEPFNMDSERDGGLGYFDGDTYVFRRNRKPIDGEDDAWLDGASEDEDDNDEEEGGGQMALDSITSVRQKKIRVASMEDNGKKKSKYVSDDDRPEDLGRRLVALLLNDEETVMMALARHGGSLRELRAREQKATKKVKLMKKRGKLLSEASEEASDAATNDAAAEMKRQLKIEIESTRDVVEELTELADGLLFGGETEAYELTRKDWNHRFKLESTLGRLKRPLDDASDDSNIQAVKKRHRGYFDNATDAEPEVSEVLTETEEVLWEYKGNEDGVVYGPYTSQQMLEWTSCGYFVGESSVDIRRVLPSPLENNTASIGGKEGEDVHADVDDLMADLLDDDDEDVETAKKSANDNATSTNEESSWLRSDRVDFKLYL